MSTPRRLAMIIGSTRPQRFADKPADWLLAQAADRTDFTLDPDRPSRFRPAVLCRGRDEPSRPQRRLKGDRLAGTRSGPTTATCLSLPSTTTP